MIYELKWMADNPGHIEMIRKASAVLLLVVCCLFFSADHSGADETGTQEISYDYSCEPVGTGLDDGFFSLETFQGKLYAGAFGYRERAAIFRYPDWEVVTPGFTVSESVCDLREFQGQLYANTESDGRIYRSIDGSSWELVFEGQGMIGCVLREYNGHLYATIHSSATGDRGKIFRSADGLRWQKVYDSGDADDYMKELIVYDGVLFGFYVDKTTGFGGYLTTRDGLNWHRNPLGQVRLFKAHVWGNELWASATTDYTQEGKSGIWKYDGTTFVNITDIEGYSHVGELIDYWGMLFATATRKWKGFGGGGALLVSTDQGVSWRTACVFPETEAWNIAEFRGELYVTTKQHLGNGKFGRLYRVTRKERVETLSADSAKTP